MLFTLNLTLKYSKLFAFIPLQLKNTRAANDLPIDSLIFEALVPICLNLLSQSSFHRLKKRQKHGLLISFKITLHMPCHAIQTLYFNLRWLCFLEHIPIEMNLLSDFTYPQRFHFRRRKKHSLLLRWTRSFLSNISNSPRLLQNKEFFMQEWKKFIQLNSFNFKHSFKTFIRVHVNWIYSISPAIATPTDNRNRHTNMKKCWCLSRIHFFPSICFLLSICFVRFAQIRLVVTFVDRYWHF